MSRTRAATDARLDDAARAGWLYYVAGDTQDEIAKKLGVSRQSAQRLVALAVSEGVVRVRLDHPIARCMELADRLCARFELAFCEITPSEPNTPALARGVASAGGVAIGRALEPETPQIVAVGAGRTLRASVDHAPSLVRPEHCIVSLLGAFAHDGSAALRHVATRLAEKIGARHFPMPAPVFARSRAELELYASLEPVRRTLELCARADVAFVGVGHLAVDAPIVLEGILSPSELDRLLAAGAVGEITGRAFDAEGAPIESGASNALAIAAPLRRRGEGLTVGVAAGPGKVAALIAALRGGLLGALVSDEATAEAILARCEPRRGERTSPSK